MKNIPKVSASALTEYTLYKPEHHTEEWKKTNALINTMFTNSTIPFHLLATIHSSPSLTTEQLIDKLSEYRSQITIEEFEEAVSNINFVAGCFGLQVAPVNTHWYLLTVVEGVSHEYH